MTEPFFLRPYRGFDVADYVADVFVGDPGTGGEADADFEERFADAVDVGGIVLVDGLLVHRLPEGARLDVCGIESHAHCLYVIVGLTVGDCRRGGVGYARSSTNSSGDDLLVGVLLSFDFQFGVERSCAEPEVGVVFGTGVCVHCYALHVLEQFLIECGHACGGQCVHLQSSSDHDRFRHRCSTYGSCNRLLRADNKDSSRVPG